MTMIRVEASSVPEILKATRLLANMTTRDIAPHIGVSHATVSAWERGVGEPSVTQFLRWARATKQPAQQLLDGLSDDVVRLEGLEPPTFWFGYDRGPGKGCPCHVNEYHGRGDCPFGCSCGWCAPELHDAFWEIVSRVEAVDA